MEQISGMHGWCREVTSDGVECRFVPQPGDRSIIWNAYRRGFAVRAANKESGHEDDREQDSQADILETDG